jgi:hypothetical protein
MVAPVLDCAQWSIFNEGCYEATLFRGLPFLHSRQPLVVDLAPLRRGFFVFRTL